MEKSNKNEVMSESNIPIWALQEDELFSRLGTDTAHGLSAAEAAARLESVGLNAISQGEQTPAWVIFLRQFKSPIVVLLVVAAGLSFAFQEWLDGTAIFPSTPSSVFTRYGPKQGLRVAWQHQSRNNTFPVGKTHHHIAHNVDFFYKSREILSE